MFIINVEQREVMDLYTTDLKKFANEDGLPIMNPSQFLIWTEKLGKERFREVLAEYIATFRPKFPLRQISYADMRTNITLLSRFNTSSICTPKEQIKKAEDPIKEKEKLSNTYSQTF